MTSFYIQAGAPATLASKSESDRSLFDAIQEVFPMNTESALMVWERIWIPIGYKYDVSYLVSPVLGLLRDLLERPKGESQVVFASTGFSAKWQLGWADGHVRVDADWTAVRGELLELVRRHPSIECPIFDFIAEWRKLFITVRDALRSAGYSGHELRELPLLEEVIKRTPCNGMLYQKTGGPQQ